MLLYSCLKRIAVHHNTAAQHHANPDLTLTQAKVVPANAIAVVVVTVEGVVMGILEVVVTVAAVVVAVVAATLAVVAAAACFALCAFACVVTVAGTGLDLWICTMVSKELQPHNRKY